ncbi:expressed unknown protein [Seminavis robusta]|uniref:Uncharacterized protein n=1 Tax=Seminavis robusta TaxID=568900 RepID=A0A9N8E8A0_9STRA|nr:expressed unknown protein [Seminavis robusta]|eukprot:Sro654_g182110.1 n/a (435) ;mRNA; r:36633-37937
MTNQNKRKRNIAILCSVVDSAHKRRRTSGLTFAPATQLESQAPTTVPQSLPRALFKTFLEPVVIAMERNPLNLKMQMEGCIALRNHTKAIGTMDRASLSALLSVLRKHSDSLVLCLALDTLRSASRDANFRSMIADHSGSMATLLDTLQASPIDGRLQEIGVSLFSYLVEEPACRKQLIEHGGVDVIISSMRNHASNTLIHCNGAAALSWLVHLNHDNATAALVANPDAIPTIYTVSKEFVDNASVLGNCMCILFGVRVGNRAVLEDYPELGGAPMRKLIQLGLRNNPKVIKVQRNCLMLLRLVTEPEENEVEMSLDNEDVTSYDDCIALVLTSMKEFSMEVEMQYLGSRVLANLAATPGLRQRIVATSGCINQVTAALLQHKTDTRIQRAAIYFLYEVLRESASQKGSEAFGGGISVLKDMLEGLGVLGEHHD